MSTPNHALADVAPGAVIDKGSPVPLHYQLERFLRQGIESGRFAPHSQLPTELELQEHFDLSRTPIRQAIGKLVADGLVMRRRSQGTVVLSRPFEEELQSLSSFTEEVQRRGQRPSARVVQFRSEPASEEDCRYLEIEPNERIWSIVRIRYINDEPVGLILSHIPVALAPHLQQQDFSETGQAQSIYHVLEHIHDVKLVRATEYFDAVSLDDESAALLRLPAGSPILSRMRISYSAEGKPVAHEQGLYRIRYRLHWSGRSLALADGGVVA
jgi:GntR family transcriptional regulator